jgi:hypothetical protein
LARDLIALRRVTPDLSAGSYATLPAPDGVWAWRRGDRHAVVVNCSDREADVVLPTAGGRVVVSTDRARDGEGFGDAIHLRAWEGCVTEQGL